MTQQTWTLFDRLAPRYDEVAPFFTRFGRSIVDAVDPAPGTRVLDLGAGRGALTGPALARGCRVTAIDRAPAMVARLSAEHPASAAYVMDAQNLDFPDDSFDVVVSSFVIHLLDDPAAGVAEAHRVLVPGGRLAFTGGSRRGTRPAPDPAGLGARLDALFLEFTDDLPAGAGFGRPVDAADLLADAGFTDLREVVAEVEIPFPDNELLWDWAMSHGYRAFIEALPAGRRAEFHERVLALPAGDRILYRSTSVWSGRKPQPSR